jgi:hypothetical protein
MTVRRLINRFIRGVPRYPPQTTPLIITNYFDARQRFVSARRRDQRRRQSRRTKRACGKIATTALLCGDYSFRPIHALGALHHTMLLL